MPEETKFTATLNLPHIKMSKKKFKKWCMSHKISRDEAELLCRLVRIFHGDISYQGIYRIGYFMPTFKSIFSIIDYEYKRICCEKLRRSLPAADVLNGLPGSQEQINGRYENQ